MSQNRSPLKKRIPRFALFFAIAAAIMPACLLHGDMRLADLRGMIPAWLVLSVTLGAALNAVFSGRQNRPCAVEYILGLCFGLLNVLCLYLYDTGSLPVTSDAGGWLNLLMRIAGQSFTAAVCMALIRQLLCRRGPNRSISTKPAAKYATLWITLLLLICWSPYILIYWPGTVNWDMALSFAQMAGAREGPITHSPAISMLWRALTAVSRRFGSENHGIGLYTCLQSAFLAWALASCVTRARELGIGKAVRVTMTVFFAVCPLFPGYAQFACSDTPFAAGITLTVLQLSKLTDREYADAHPWRSAAVLFIALTAACVTRVTNTLPFVMAVLAVAVILLIALCARRLKQYLPQIAAAALCTAVCAVWSFGVLPGMGIVAQEETAVSATLYQTTARILRDAPETVSPQEYEAVAAVFTHPDALGDLYDANICDPVKYDTKRYGNPDVDSAAEAAYRKAALSMIRRSPRTALEAVLNGTMGYYAFTPKLTVPTYNNQAGMRIEFNTYDVSRDPRALHTVHSVGSDSLRQKLADFALGWQDVPLLRVTYAPALYVWLAAVIAFTFLKQKRGRKLWLYAPLLPVLGVCLLSQVNDYMRYFFPVLCAVPLLICEAKSREYAGESLK